jgi:hypothetical protein
MNAANERDRPGFVRRRSGIRDPAGQHEAIVLPRTNVREYAVDPESAGRLIVLGRLDLPSFERHEMKLCAGAR